jgi:hypothetical protein
VSPSWRSSTAGWSPYLLIAALLVVNASPWVQRLPTLGVEAMEAVAGQRPAERVLEGMADIRTPVLVAVALNIGLFAVIILDMVLKPF